MALDQTAIAELVLGVSGFAGTVWAAVSVLKSRQESASRLRDEDRKREDQQRADVLRAIDGMAKDLAALRAEEQIARGKMTDDLRDIRDSIAEGSTALGKLQAEVAFLGRETESLKAEGQRQRDATHALRNELSSARLRAAADSKQPP